MPYNQYPVISHHDVFPAQDDYCKLSKREEAALYVEESFSSEYLSEVEEVNFDTTRFSIDAIVSDRIVFNPKLNKEVREYQVAWKDSAAQLTWELESRLMKDCPNLVLEYISNDEDYEPPKKARTVLYIREEQKYERASRSSSNKSRRDRVKAQLAAELENLRCFDDFVLPGSDRVESILRTRGAKRKAANLIYSSVVVERCFSTDSSSNSENFDVDALCASNGYLEKADENVHTADTQIYIPNQTDKEPAIPTMEELSELMSSDHADNQEETSAPRRSTREKPGPHPRLASPSMVLTSW